ncbi:unnamed protein product [Didymodactylos carnosus]|uniref:Reverse transcriptase domain-containing protein n=1 Tax=Didymodactylos carnosus TaxID=1234261 RepID=A0A814DLU3_9BILA|nr:unnamed protein product [Didymodactylos carnosus]CAF0957320.1 unnamed protein product [Didymodactylos carnosus]CAF3660716.1 unnamed protein product [Didymodactylos carnosus]CAF3732169.1 unnamed protein product [Didymodactylos carnosus]
MSQTPEHTQYGLFADDTALWAACNITSGMNRRIHESVDAFQRWCTSWKLSLQPTKTEMIHFSPHPRKKYKYPMFVVVGPTIVCPQPFARYLGVIFDPIMEASYKTY